MTDREALVAIGHKVDGIEKFDLTKAEKQIIEVLIEQKIGHWNDTAEDKVFEVFEKSSLGDYHA